MDNVVHHGHCWWSVFWKILRPLGLLQQSIPLCLQSAGDGQLYKECIWRHPICLAVEGGSLFPHIIVIELDQGYWVFRNHNIIKFTSLPIWWGILENEIDFGEDFLLSAKYWFISVFFLPTIHNPIIEYLVTCYIRNYKIFPMLPTLHIKFNPLGLVTVLMLLLNHVFRTYGPL